MCIITIKKSGSEQNCELARCDVYLLSETVRRSACLFGMTVVVTFLVHMSPLLLFSFTPQRGLPC